MCTCVSVRAHVWGQVGVGLSERRVKKKEKKKRGWRGGYNAVALSFVWVTRPLSSLQRPCRNKRISFEWRFSWWYFTAKISGIGMCFFSCNIELGWFWWPGIQYSHLSTCSILQSVWYFVHDYITNTTPPPLPRPPPRPNSFASADDISKELLAPYEAGWGEKAYLDKTGPQSGHGPKGQSPIHVKVAGGVCAGRGSAWGCQRGLFESGRIFEAREWKEVDHKARHTSNTPRHIFTLSFPRRRRVYKVGSQCYGMACRTRSRK